VLGCGLGLNADTKEIVRTLLRETACPLVLDADGINALAAHMDKGNPKGSLLKPDSRPCPLPVLTPHPGEMARLTGLSIEEIERNRIEVARDFAGKYHVVLVLKGAQTVVAGPNQPPRTCSLPPNSGLAKGGSGDLLAGMLAGLLAQGMQPYEAAFCAVQLHALAAQRASKRLSARGMTALDCIDELKILLSQFE